MTTNDGRIFFFGGEEGEEGDAFQGVWVGDGGFEA